MPIDNTFVVEDGSGLAGANAYISVQSLDNYLSSYYTPSTEPDSVKESAIKIASTYIDSNNQFRGKLLNQDQGLKWPRVNATCVTSAETIPVASDEVPSQIEYAVAEYAMRQLAGSLQPDPNVNGKITSQTNKLGQLEQSTSYQEGSQAGNILSYPYADSLFSCLVTSSAGGQSFNVVRC